MIYAASVACDAGLHKTLVHHTYLGLVLRTFLIFIISDKKYSCRAWCERRMYAEQDQL